MSLILKLVVHVTQELCASAKIEVHVTVAAIVALVRLDVVVKTDVVVIMSPT